jgi:hypothetical protein
MILYLVIALVSLALAFVLALIIRSLLDVVGLVRHHGTRGRSDAKEFDLKNAFVLSFDPSNPTQMMVRKVPYTNNMPSPVWDGRLRRPWGW